MLISLGPCDCGTTAYPVYEWYLLDGLMIRGDRLAQMLYDVAAEICGKAKSDRWS